MSYAYLDSDLSGMNPPIDVAVALLPHSLDVQLHKTFGGDDLPTLTQYYALDVNGNPQVVSRESLLKSSEGVDPFDMPARGTPEFDQAIAKLRAAYFAFAFRGTLGLPSGYAPLTVGGPALPPIFLANSGQTATFRLLFGAFDVIRMNYAPRGEPFEQTSQQPRKAWTADLLVNLENVSVSAEEAPAAVAKAASTLKDRLFDVRRLMIDFSKAKTTSVAIGGVPKNSQISSSLVSEFLVDFVKELQKYDWPPLNYTVVAKSSPDHYFPITSAQLVNSPYRNGGTADPASPLSTVCYRCAVQSHKLPPPAAFPWNWLNASDAQSADGVVAINRDSLQEYFYRELLPYAQQNCITPHASVKLNSMSQATYHGSYTRGYTPTVTEPSSGSNLLSMNYTASSFDQAGLNGGLGQLQLKSGFDLSVSVADNVITVAQQLTFFVKLRKLASTVQGYYFNTSITDTYTITTSSRGQLTAQQQTHKVDNSTDHHAGNCVEFWTKIDHKIDDIVDVGDKFFAVDIKPIPISVIQDFYFPGGNVFTFSGVHFSNNQDLISLISYAR